MAYNTQKLKGQAITAIEKHRLFFIEDVVAYLPCSKPTFYEHFPNESDDRKDIDELLEKNKIEVKVSMRSKWYKSDNPTLQMGLMKLLSSPAELKKLAMQHQEHSGETINTIKVSYVEPEQEDNETP